MPPYLSKHNSQKSEPTWVLLLISRSCSLRRLSVRIRLTDGDTVIVGVNVDDAKKLPLGSVEKSSKAGEFMATKKSVNF